MFLMHKSQEHGRLYWPFSAVAVAVALGAYLLIPTHANKCAQAETVKSINFRTSKINFCANVMVLNR